MTPRARLPAILLLAAALFLPGKPASAAELTVDLGGRVETFTTGQLLARPDTTTIEVRQDVVYGRQMTYRAVPLRGLLQGMRLGAEEESRSRRATASSPCCRQRSSSRPRQRLGPMLAIEPPDAPWPSPGQGMTTGPFYLVWLDPAASGVRSEQWPFAVAAIRPVPPPPYAGPRSPSAATSRPAPRSGGPGAGRDPVHGLPPRERRRRRPVGPDLNLPLSPTEYSSPRPSRPPCATPPRSAAGRRCGCRGSTRRR